MSFNPANFPWTNPIVAAVHAKGPNSTPEIVANAISAQKSAATMVADLRDAAARFELRAQTNNAWTCRDLASRLERFGSFVSERQAGYAKQLVEWSQPKVAAPVAAPVRQPAVRPTMVPKLFDLMQRLAKLEIGLVTIARKNGDSLCWIKHSAVEGVVGKIEGGIVYLFAKCQDKPWMMNALLVIEQDPEAAAVLHGRASGRCSVCSRDLTDPESIERGIGPICAGKF